MRKIFWDNTDTIFSTIKIYNIEKHNGEFKIKLLKHNFLLLKKVCEIFFQLTLAPVIILLTIIVKS